MTRRFFFLLIISHLITAPVHAYAYESFKPAWWCRGAHAQTIYGGLFRPAPNIALRRERVEIPDGDFLDLDWLDSKEKSPMVIILHGLGSSSKAPYALSLFREIQNRGWQAVALNARGVREPNRLSETSHGGQTKDLNWLIHRILDEKKADKIFLVGYSIGGNQTLKWLGEQGTNVPEVEKAAAVSTPYNLEAAVHNLDKGFEREVYTRAMLKGLKATALQKEKLFPGTMDREKVKNANTFTVYDREVTARVNGFKDEKDYWSKSSSVHFLNQIQRPVLLIHAQNDPFLPLRDLPLEEIKKSSWLQWLLTQDGGHLGFVSGSCPFRPDPWLEKTILDFFLN
ncbi:MAG: alpha/beta fold hydrolase [Candidatus Omnitrophica bacterium]|nr:alpha/beta fold hydrolase [Candidatus Omnitrophota bacterium]